jgi:hypothetical protein
VRTALTLLLVGVFAISSGCGGQASRSGSDELETLSSIGQFQRAFDGDHGHARLVILLSPT